MATKTFKIGLSATDKQNMAQDVYERLLALTFPEYDTNASYSVGDFVVYNDQLYKCIGNTSGTWDATKWQLATLNDLLTDIESAVAFVNNKATVDGNYPTMTVGLADNLTPYSEDSGAEQEQPFISQGTGCGNGTEIVTTGDYALLKEKQGHTLKVVQMVHNGDFSDGTTWWNTSSDTPLSVSNGICTFTASAQYKNAYQAINFVANHKYLAMVKVKLTTATTNVVLQISVGNERVYQPTQSNTDWQTLFACGTITTSGYGVICVQDNRTSDFDAIQFTDVYLFDITELDADAIADLTAHPENFFRYYNGSLAFNEGSLESSDGRYLVATGRNLFAGNSEDNAQFIGNYEIDNADGFKLVSSGTRNCFRIRVNPNADFSIFTTGSTLGIASIVRFVDKDYNLISGSATGYSDQRNVKTTPSNCAYIEVSLSKTYAGNICITPYYPPEDGGEGYDQYYPYKEPTIVDTGSETLLSAGSVKDVKLPSGAITRKVVSINLSNLTWNSRTTIEGKKCWKATYTGLVYPGYTIKQNITSDKYEPESIYQVAELQTKTNTICFFSGEICVYNGSDTIEPSGNANFELATPTTEQGTTFSENVKINDYGMMYWLDSSNNLVGIPQGNYLFYPVNYKGYVDDVYSRTDGDASKLVIQSELSAIDTQLKNALGGTLRQCLCVKESLDFDNTDFVDLGELNWMYMSQNFFTASIPNIKVPASVGLTTNILCSKYKEGTSAYDSTMSSVQNLTIHQGVNDTAIKVKDTAYTDATAFKTAIKGVLLAYEKA